MQIKILSMIHINFMNCLDRNHCSFSWRLYCNTLLYILSYADFLDFYDKIQVSPYFRFIIQYHCCHFFPFRSDKNIQNIFFHKFHYDNHKLYDYQILEHIISNNILKCHSPIWKHHRLSYTHRWAWRPAGNFVCYL